MDRTHRINLFPNEYKINGQRKERWQMDGIVNSVRDGIEYTNKIKRKLNDTQTFCDAKLFYSKNV